VQRPTNILKAMAILLVCFSVMWLLGLSFAAGFHQPIEIINRTSVPILVTPIGVWHESKALGTLPVTASRIIHWPALQDGDFALVPGQSIRVVYDSDDIDPSDIYVDAGPGRVFEVSVKQRTPPGFDYEKDRRIEIADLSRLKPASAPVTAAALGANKNEWAVFWFSLFLLGPLVFGAGLWVLGKLFEKQEIGKQCL
jgi:hypothetical protein